MRQQLLYLLKQQHSPARTLCLPSCIPGLEAMDALG
jgi:hypothetical protein